MDTTAYHAAPARLRNTPSWLLSQATAHAHRLVWAAFADAGVRRYHYALLAALEEYGPASQAELGRRCGIDRSDVVAALNELAGRDLVRRSPDPADRRRNIVTVTTAGVRHLGLLDESLDRAQDELLTGLSPDERAQLVRLLARVLEHHSPR
ncbi:MarR family transcriptional regulator [Streptomyces sp. TRM 70361]|uniref:MarR family winged helix-turn-helix transcriptional regulator n=1 Tax=Streptomyces sp. TRM 70361 TaxID=3116553 RepID=UPI002E7C0D92|nr:MarR family transcriptional regulator [Streptomyces sp. TRM 70361]MEE1940271.1 MarR family transcriptional regulator [Streptomyces sp. TRM 70361]